MGFIDFNYYTDALTQKSENWIYKIAPTIAGIIIGFGLNRTYDYIKERKEINNAGEEFINEIGLYKETLEKQIVSINEALVNLKNEKRGAITIVTYIREDEDRFKSISRLFIYKYFKKRNDNDAKESRRHVNRLFGIIKIAEHEAIRFSEFYEIYVSGGASQHKAFTKAINGMLRGFTKLIVDIEATGKNPNDDSFIKALNPFFTTLKNNQDKNILEISELVCKPMTSVIATHRTDPRKDLISDNLKICFECLNEFNTLKKNFIYQLTQLDKTFKKLVSESSEIITKYPI